MFLFIALLSLQPNKKDTISVIAMSPASKVRDTLIKTLGPVMLLQLMREVLMKVIQSFSFSNRTCYLRLSNNITGITNEEIASSNQGWIHERISLVL